MSQSLISQSKPEDFTLQTGMRSHESDLIKVNWGVGLEIEGVAYEVDAGREAAGPAAAAVDCHGGGGPSSGCNPTLLSAKRLG